MFANAVMFNPDTKRGFGPAFRLGDGLGVDDDDDDGRNGGGAGRGQEVGDVEGGEDGEDDGGVVRDTREMFAAVEKSVAAWRAAERAAEEAAGGRAVAPGPVPVAARLRGGSGGEEREEDDKDELAGDEGGKESGTGRESLDGEALSQRHSETVKRRKRG